MTKPDDSPLAPTSRPHHDCVVELMDAMPRGKVLDIPAGEGELTVRLRAMGFETEACDIDPARWKASPPLPRPGNMNDRVPFEDGAFDYVVCVKGLHRIYGVGRAVSEFARVLKPGGDLFRRPTAEFRSLLEAAAGMTGDDGGNSE